MEEKKWYVVNTYSGHESKVKEKLDMRITFHSSTNKEFTVEIFSRPYRV